MIMKKIGKKQMVVLGGLLFGLCIILFAYLLNNFRSHVVVKHEADEKVAYLKEGIFQKKESLAWIRIPDGVTVLSKNIFNGCTALKNIYLPDSLYKIDDSAFAHCDNLISIRIPSSVKFIGNSAFEGCTKLNNIYIGEYDDENKGLEIIGEKAFYNTALVGMEIPYTVKYIGDEAWGECPYLLDLSVPYEYIKQETVEKLVGEYYSEDLIIYQNTLEINELDQGHNGLVFGINGDSAFVRKGNAQSIPNSIKYDDHIYHVTWIGTSAYEGSDITQITLPKYLLGIDKSAFANCLKLKEVVFPNSIKVIRERAFYGDTEIDEFDLTKTNILSIIEKSAFWGLKEIEVPGSVEIIESGGLAGIPKVKIGYGVDINYMADIFGSGKELEELSVPLAWKNSDQWDRLKIDEKKVILNIY